MFPLCGRTRKKSGLHVHTDHRFRTYCDFKHAGAQNNSSTSRRDRRVKIGTFEEETGETRICGDTKDVDLLAGLLSGRVRYDRTRDAKRHADKMFLGTLFILKVEYTEHAPWYANKYLDNNHSKYRQVSLRFLNHSFAY